LIGSFLEWKKKGDSAPWHYIGQMNMVGRVNQKGDVLFGNIGRKGLSSFKDRGGIVLDEKKIQPEGGVLGGECGPGLLGEESPTVVRIGKKKNL